MSSRWPPARHGRSHGRRARGQSDFSGEMAFREMAWDDLPQLGLRRLADLLRVRAAWMERASGRKVDRAGQLSLDLRTAALEFRIRHRDGCEKRLGVRMEWLSDYLLRFPELDDSPQVHHRNPVGHVPSDPDVVGDEHQGEPELIAELEQEIHDPRADRDVEHGHGLVRHDELRLEDDRPRNRDPLPLSAAQLVRIPVHEVGRRRKFGMLERLRDQVFPILQGIRHAVYRQRLRDRVHHGEPRVEREELPQPTDVPDGAILRHARLPENISFAKWQRERWPVSTSMSSGRSRVQMSCANRQRGWKRHPVGGLTRSGGDPGIARSFFLGPFTLGNASRRPSTYGCEGRSKTASVVPSSTISPAYMMTIRSETSATTEMSWVMIIIARSSSRCRSRISPRIRSCMMTSRAVVGSSAMIRSGLHASAMAIIARCFMPPENSCG